MSIEGKGIKEITATDIAELVGTIADSQQIATLGSWSREGAATAAASLANTRGGLLIVGAVVDDAGRVNSIEGTAISEEELRAAFDDLGPAGRHLAQTRIVEVGSQRVALAEVAESAAPPVLVETNGTIYRRSADGLTLLRTRGELDLLLAKERASRQQAERNIEGTLDRLAFGHLNYMTVGVLAASRVLTNVPYHWALEHQSALLGLDFAKAWRLTPSDVQVRAGEIELTLAGETTGIIRIARNGCVAVAERQVRPAQHLYLSPSELAQRLTMMARTAALPFQTIGASPVLGALFLEGVRELRLPVEGGATAPVARDLVREFLSEYYFDDGAACATFSQDLLRAAGTVFAADLVAGTGKPAVAAASKGPEPKSWHGLTKRTERRLAGLRGHGSGR